MSDDQPEVSGGECSPERLTPRAIAFRGSKSRKKCKCNLCGKWFLHGGHLRRHLQDVHSSEKKLFECDLCHKSFSRNDYLKLHKRNVHSLRTPSNSVDRSFADDANTKREKLLRILAGTGTTKGSETTCECPQCHKICTRVDRLKIHIKKKHGIVMTDSKPKASKDEAHCCSQCDEKFSTAERLRSHMRVTHLNQRLPRSVDQRDVIEDQQHRETSDGSIGRSVRRCLDCGKTFLSKDGFKAHMWSHVKHRFDSNKPVTDEPDTADSPEEPQKIEQVAVKLLKCDECERSFAEYTEIRFHMLSHIANKSYKCSDCPKTFALVSLLNRHRLIIHAPVKQHRCENCSERFMTLHELQSHSRLHVSVETGSLDEAKLSLTPTAVGAGSVKAYACHLCDKQFDELRSMNIHVTKAHLRKNSYECESCKQRFESASDLAEHSETHKANLQHVCGACGQVFKMASQLTLHLKTHGQNQPEQSDVSEPFQCKKCNKKFSHHGYYARHLMIGNCTKFFAPDRPGFEPHKCQFCPKSFNWSSNLYRHIKVAHVCDVDNKTNLTERFVCPKCRKRFYQEDTFERHCTIGKCCLGARKPRGRNGRFKCSKCGMLFTFRTNLRRHTKQVHGNLHLRGKKQHRSNDCHRVFKHVVGLARHASEEQSEVGRKDSKVSQVGIGKTKASKTIEKQYGCPKCDKAFTTSGNVNRHLRVVHNDTKQRECDECCQVFMTFHDLITHSKKGLCKAKDNGETSALTTQDQEMNVSSLENSETDVCADTISAAAADPPSLVADSTEEELKEKS